MIPVIEIQNLSKTYKKQKKNQYDHPALSNLNLTIQSGEIYGFLGPNGAGKTTTIKLILGFIHSDEGTLNLLGRPAGDPAVRMDVGYMPEIAYYYWYMKAGELLHIYGRMFHLSSHDLKKRIPDLLEKVGLPGKENTFLKDFSKGMLQRFSLAQALLNQPKLLILDEPASGLDPVGRKDIRETIFELNRQGVTIFFSSHELSTVEMISTRVGILNKGQMVREGKLEELLPESQKIHIHFWSILTPETIDDATRRIRQNTGAMDLFMEWTISEGRTLLVLGNRAGFYPVMRALESMNLMIESAMPQRDSLEDLFMRIVQEEA